MIGSKLSHYQITAELGRGGMGVVYEARDEKLKRRVALKVLPPKMASDPQRLERFRREAEAVAKLSHPSIVSIHSFEEADGVHFLTMELIKGESLDAALQGGALSLARVLRIGQSIAEALAKAHAEGVVHRDLKPANVMLTEDGHVKVLDFGLAKLAADPDPAEAQATQLRTKTALTDAGTVLGTVAYMSPEQARGEPVDHRGDVFSLGCVLYQAATGNLPFPGPSSIDTLHQIVHDHPRPVDELVPEAPPQLQWILRKALAKEPRERYQSAHELSVDLKSLRRDLDSGEAPSGASTPPRVGEPPAKRAPVGKLVAWFVVALAAVALPWWLSLRSMGEPRPAAPTPASLSMRSLTASGRVTCAAISPDGKHLVYIQSYQGEQSLHLREVDGPRDVELIPPRLVSYWDATFTPDGTGIVFAQLSADEPKRAFFRISTLGGKPRKLLSGAASGPSFSPDGRRMAWVRGQYPTASESSLMVANADGTEVAALASVQNPERLHDIFFTGPSWSPDGTLIAATVATASTTRIKAFSTSTGELEWTGSRPWPFAARVVWLPDGDGLLAIAVSPEDTGAPRGRRRGQIWFVPYPTGDPVRLTTDLLDYRVLSLSRDAQRFVTVARTWRSDVFVMPRDGSGLPRKISRSVDAGRFGVVFLADGRIVFQTPDGSGTSQLAIVNPDGSGYRQLTEDAGDSIYPRTTPQGRIVYLLSTAVGEEIWAMDPDDGERAFLAKTTRNSGRFSISPDGNWGVYSAYTEGREQIWRVPLTGGSPERLTEFEAWLGAVSPDNKRIAYYYRDPTTGLELIGVMPFAPGRPELQLDFDRNPFQGSMLEWTRDGQALLVSSAPSDRANLWRLPLDGGEPQRLTDFTDLRLYAAAFSPDGETMALTRGQSLRDAVLVEGLR